MSIFDIEDKQPITIKDLSRAGFKSSFIEEGSKNEIFFEFEVRAPHTMEKTWAIRFYPRGTRLNGQKLRSNRLIYKDFQTDKTRKEIDDCRMKRMRKISTSRPLSQSKRMPKQGYYTKKYMRNIGKLEFDMVLSIVAKQFKNLK